MIDAHIHVVPPNLPGVGSLNPLLEAPASQRAAALRQEMAEAGIGQVLAMGCYPAADDPAGIQATLQMAALVPGLRVAAVADPARAEPRHLEALETALAQGQVVALKVYLGYLPFPADHPGYRSCYELAGRTGAPVVFHTGDTYSPRARLRLAHPLLLDDVAVDHPDVRFVLAHMGNPWLLDAAEVIAKNVNVWADLSGLLVGPAESYSSEERKELLHDTAQSLARAFRYAERPNRFVYGSDWPLTPMAAYRDFIRSAIPEAHHQQVFEDNARLLFRL